MHFFSGFAVDFIKLLLLPVQLIGWKDSSLNWHAMCHVGCYTLITHSLTQYSLAMII